LSILSGSLVILWAAQMAAAMAPDAVRFAGRAESAGMVPLQGVRVQLRTASGEVRQGFTDSQGRFTIEVPAAGQYSLLAERDGYYAAVSRSIEVSPHQEEALITLYPVREQIESIDVTAPPPAIDMDTTSARRLLTSQEIVNIPYPNTNDLKSALRAVPGVVRDNRGGLHVNGAAEDQVLYTLNGFNLNDPLTGRFESRLSVESVENIEVSTGNLPAEYGKGSGGVLAVRTQTGGDNFRFTATNFVPGVENRKGWTIGDWTPRFNVSGPIRRGRTWFANSIDIGYNRIFVRELPKGEDRNTSLRLGNLLHLQHNLTPSQILSGGLLVNVINSPRSGLSAIDPRGTTIDRRSRQWFVYVRDQVYLAQRTLLEFGYAANRTFGREIPQGSGMLLYTPFGKRGNHFVDGIRQAGRDQFTASASLPSFSFRGAHQLRTGADLNHLKYRQDVRRTGYENYGVSGVLTSRTVFGGSGVLERTNQEVTLYVQDSWRVTPGILVELGIRGDWDRILAQWSASPRAGVSWSPAGWSETRFYAGLAQVADATNLRVFTRQMDQYSVTTYFSPDGTITRGPALNVFTIQNPSLKRPVFRVISGGGAHRWSNGFMLRVDLLQRRGSNGFAYHSQVFDPQAPLPAWAAPFEVRALDAVYGLYNRRTDRYDSVSATVRRRIRSEYEWLVSYTRSRALSNTAVDVSVEDPISFNDATAPMPWDVPHRFVGWGYLPLPRTKWALAFLADARTGFPFSVRTEDRMFVGGVNTFRYPAYFELNLHFERRFRFRTNMWAFRFGSNNVTNRINPDMVNGNSGSPDVGRFYGGTGRSYNFRVRWLGRIR
jgi:hypothetical protein